MAGCLVRSSLFALVMLAGSAHAQSEAYCGGYFDQPDIVVGSGSCSDLPSPPSLVATASAFTMGDAYEASAPTITWDGLGVSPCHDDQTPSGSVAFRAAVGGSRAIAATRFDLIAVPLASQAGFQHEFILETATPWASVTDFFDLDASADCSGGCSWSDNYDGRTELGFGSPYRLRDLIDADGGDYRTKAYYISKSTTETDYGPLAGLADLTNAAYRAWRVADAQALLATGAYEYVTLSHKFCQYRFGQENWLNGTLASNCGETAGVVDDVTKLHDAGSHMWTAEPTDYGWSEYVQGWAAMADDLKAAGVPFVVHLNASYWLSPSTYDDPATVGINEATLITDTAEDDASIVVMDHDTGDGKARGVSLRVKRMLEAAGREVLVVDLRCGQYGGPLAWGASGRSYRPPSTAPSPNQ